MQPQINPQFDSQAEPQLDPQATTPVEAQPTAEPIMQTDLQPEPLTVPPRSSSLRLLSILGIIIASLSLVLSITSIIITNQNRQPSNLNNDKVAGSFEGKTPKIECNLPKSSDEIVYLYLSTGSGTTGIFVSPEGNIESYVRKSNDAGNVLSTTKSIETNTNDIFEQLIQNGIDNFSSYEYPDYSDTENQREAANWSWLAQIDNADSSSCEARGNDTPPVWFEELVNRIDEKFNQ